MIQVQMLVSRKECFCTERNTFAIVVRTVAPIDANPLASVTGLALLCGTERVNEFETGGVIV